MFMLFDPRGWPRWTDRHPYAAQSIWAFALALITEMLSRRSPIQGILFMFKNPAVFVCDALIILFTLSIAMVLPRRRFFTTLISAVWLGLATANCIVLGFRITPISAIDLLILKSGFSIVGMYLSVFQIVLLIVGVVLLAVLLFLVFITSARKPHSVVRGLGLVLVSGLALTLWMRIPPAITPLSSGFANLHKAYETYGFAYCFSSSLVDRGVDKPKDYSDKTVTDAMKALDDKPSPNPDPAVKNINPNIIFVQLESFFDPSRMSALKYAEDPIPNFRKLKESCSSGWLTVPSLGAGTANTEFEVLTGMSLDYFGAGEYPYETILQKTACETLAYNLRPENYSSHALHNHRGNFYDRNLVFSSLGFDTFSSVEYMQGFHTNPTNWCCDDILTGEIMKSMNSTDNRDLVYTISVQGHGKYPRTQKEGVPYMENSGMGDEAEGYAWGYYLTQLQAMDTFIGQLVDSLSKFSEPCVLVLYGDHLPNFNISDSDLKAGTVFDSEYLIWSNFGLEKQNKDLYSYQLSAEVLGRLGCDNGVLTKLHQRRATDPDYQETLELLEYDLLYGDRAAIGGTELEPTKLQMGTLPVKINNVKQAGTALYISGQNFTHHSSVLLNGERQETLYIDSRNLMVANLPIASGDHVSIGQFTAGDVMLSQTEEFVYGEIGENGQTESPGENEENGASAHSAQNTGDVSQNQ